MDQDSVDNGSGPSHAGRSRRIGTRGRDVGILNDLPKLDIPINSGRSAPIRIYDSGHPATLLAELAGPLTADPVPAQDMPEVLRQALIAAEDEAFLAPRNHEHRLAGPDLAR